MPLSEAHCVSQLMQVLKPLAPQRIENELTRGAADIETTRGWIEVKWAKQWPAKSQIVVPHWSPQQKAWHLRKDAAQGVTYVMLFVAHDVLLLRGKRAVRLLNECSKEQLFRAAIRQWQENTWKWDLIHVLRASWLTEINNRDLASLQS